MIRYDPQWSQFNPVTCGCYNQAADDTDRVRRPRSKHSFRSKPRLITASRPPGASDTNRSRARQERERERHSRNLYCMSCSAPLQLF